MGFPKRQSFWARAISTLTATGMWSRRRWGSHALYLLPGDGQGGFGPARSIKLPGTVTALVTGEINRRDGLTDIVVGITGRSGPQVLVFEGTEGALAREPEIFTLPGEATALALGQLDESYEMDLAVACRSDQTGCSHVLIIHGRDRRLSLDEIRQAEVLPATIDQRSSPFAITSIAVGDFIRDQEHRTDVALLSEDGSVHVVSKAKGKGQKAKGKNADSSFVIRQWSLDIGSESGATRLVRAKVSSLPTDDLVVLDPSNQQVHVLTTGNGPRTNNKEPITKNAVVSLDTDGSPVAALPMRLNADVLSDLVILKGGETHGSNGPAVVLTMPLRTFTVTNTNDSGAGSLRQAILDAEAMAGLDAINFNIPGAGPHTIRPTSALPNLTSVLIDGTTQPGFMGTPIIELDGSMAGVTDGLNLAGGGAVRGLVINRFNSSGIRIESFFCLIEGNFIGTNVTGTAGLGNAIGVSIFLFGEHQIGGTTPEARNLISGNVEVGVFISAPNTDPINVEGNYIGTDVTGTAALANSVGVLITDNMLTSVPIGGTTSGARNLISGNGSGVIIDGGQDVLVRGNFIGTDVRGTADLGNTGSGVLIQDARSNGIFRNVISGNGHGVRISGSSATGNQVQGNYIGTDVTGTAALGNGVNGVSIEGASNNTIGGITAGARNVISGNDRHGVEILGPSATGNQVQGNFIGTNAAGTAALGNLNDGVQINGASNNTIGGTAAGARNIISGNDSDGVEIGQMINTTVNLVQGNFIGTDVTGTAALGNNLAGVFIRNGSDNMIGGAMAGAGNVISGNGSGVVMDSPGATGNDVQGNFIGTNATGTNPLGNTEHGVVLTSSARNNTIGGLFSDEGNTIAFNGGVGVLISGANTRDNRISRNAIFSNGGLGIDLGGDGVTLNDLGMPPDADTGANNLQNFPDFSAFNLFGDTIIEGTLQSTRNTPFLLEFFTNTGCDPSGFGEGERFIDEIAVMTDSSGTASFMFRLLVTVPLGQFITATATAGNNTSEFSQCIEVVQGVPPPLVVNQTGDQSDADLSDHICETDPVTPGIQCTLRAAIEQANANSGLPETINFNIPGGGVPTIRPQQPLPTVTDPVVIDATTQPGGRVELDGSQAGPNANGLRITAGNSTVKGLVINRFQGHGIALESISVLQPTGDNVIEGNCIGTDATGTADLGNAGSGVFISGSPGNRIGGITAEARNVISGNDRNGVEISGSFAAGNRVQGNFIGTDITGTADLGNAVHGVVITNALNNTIGGTMPGAANVMSGNDNDGVSIGGAGATGNVVQGNYIGTDVSGTADLGNSLQGVNIAASNNTIGGTTPEARNIISGNNQNGVMIFRSEATGNVVRGNFIGTDVTGTADLGNTLSGVEIEGSPGHQIGGLIAGAGNVISGNDKHGVEIIGASATGNVVQGNFIGTDVTGTADLGNSGDGVRLFDASRTTVGGTTTEARNVISGNDNSGIRLVGATARGNLVQGNFIGSDVTGTADVGNTLQGVLIVEASSNIIGGAMAGAGNVISGNDADGLMLSGRSVTRNQVQGNFIGTQVGGSSPLGNTSHGVFMTDLANNNTIGGTGVTPGSCDGPCNTIAFNGADGVLIGPTAGTGNAIRSNAIFSNTGLGIDLGADGVTLNDTRDPDTGANQLQNFPKLAKTVFSGGSTTIAGTLNSTPNTMFTLEFFSNAACDPSKYGEGARFIGTVSVGTNPLGNANFMVTFATRVAGGQVITATATDPANNTSEFSPCVSVREIVCTLEPATATNPVGTDHTVTATVTENGTPLAGVLVSFGVSDGPNTGLTGAGLTDRQGQASFTYTGNGGVGIDTIKASGQVAGITFLCFATKEWVKVIIRCQLDPPMATSRVGPAIR
ncbi:MAG: hypothetical protein HY314_15280 [Acidobacteria bacterium]|nr:hypothetical protein [Acidobacteriota bacterium]